MFHIFVFIFCFCFCFGAYSRLVVVHLWFCCCLVLVWARVFTFCVVVLSFLSFHFISFHFFQPCSCDSAPLNIGYYTDGHVSFFLFISFFLSHSLSWMRIVITIFGFDVRKQNILQYKTKHEIYYTILNPKHYISLCLSCICSN